MRDRRGFRFLVLGLLRDGKARHGYGLMKAYKERSGVVIGTGSFYRALQSLVADGLVRKTANPTGDDPRRTPHAITTAGVAAFDAWIRANDAGAISRHYDELFNRVLFLGETEAALARSIIDQWQEVLCARGRSLERAREAALARAKRGGTTTFAALPLLLARCGKHVAADWVFLKALRVAYDEWTDRVADAPGCPSRLAPAPASITHLPGRLARAGS
jgi:DNA-binding PadR family transcriptional regulator